MDLKSYEPLIGSLLRKSAPAIAGILTLGLTPVIGPFAGFAGTAAQDLIPMIADAMGAPADTPPDQLATMIDADPQAADKLAALNETHSFTLADAKQKLDAAAVAQKEGDDFAVASQGQQTAVNTVEASNGSWFVAGWRPALGWALGALVVMSFIIPYPVWLLQQIHINLTSPPDLSQNAFWILGAILGLNIGARSVDKALGTATTSLGGVTKTITTNAVVTKPVATVAVKPVRLVR